MKKLLSMLGLQAFLIFPLQSAVIYQTERGRIGNIPPFDLPERSDFDVNGDGTLDLSFEVTLGTNEFIFWTDGPVGGAVVTFLDVATAQYGVASLPADFEIGPILGEGALEFTEFSPLFKIPLVTSPNGSNPRGPFYQNPGYLGFQFEAADGVHYGYIYLEEVQSLSAIYHGFAYESEPNTPILAGAIPEPSSGLMVLMGGGLLMRRKRTE